MKRNFKTDNLFNDFKTPDKASRKVKLKQFTKFGDMTEALASATAAVEGKMSKSLKKVLKKIVAEEAHESLAVADAKLGNVIKDKFNISCIANSSIQELMRCIRSKEMTAMALDLAHSLSRYKLKFSPDKVDTMIIQAVSLLDDLNKELNNYIMRCKGWYGWHFPELSEVVTDNLQYVRTVQAIGQPTNAIERDLSDVLQEAKMKELAEMSTCTEVSDEDIRNILHLCHEIVKMSNYRSQLFE